MALEGRVAGGLGRRLRGAKGKLGLRLRLLRLLLPRVKREAAGLRHRLLRRRWTDANHPAVAFRG